MCVTKTEDASMDAQTLVLDFDATSQDRWRDDGGPVDSLMEETLVPALLYPLYLIANDTGVLVAKTRGKFCIMLFHRKQFADRHIAEAAGLRSSTPFYPLAIQNADAFREGLESLPADINCAVWDATFAPSTFVYMEMNDLLQAIAE
jgi:hypothetical protein